MQIEMEPKEVPEKEIPQRVLWVPSGGVPYKHGVLSTPGSRFGMPSSIFDLCQNDDAGAYLNPRSRVEHSTNF